MKSLFKANDIRGVFGQTLSVDTARDIGRALAAAAREKKATAIAVGRDGRLSSPQLSAALQEGLLAGGMGVTNIGLAPTPLLYYAAHHLAAGNGVMVTGSHNPKNHNGFKIVLGGKTLRGDDLQSLRRRIQLRDFGETAMAGAEHRVDISAQYIDAVIAACPISRPLTVVVDAGNGATGPCAPRLFSRLGCSVAPLFCDIDGNFPHHHPDPAQPQNLIAARRRLAECDGDIALVFDGDGDRLGVILRGGESIFADRLLMVFARDMLSRHPRARVVFDVKCSMHLPPWIVRHGGIADMQPTGHAFIKARMQDTGALLGGEMSGHFYFRENWFGFDDALFAAARLLSIVAQRETVFDDLPPSIASPELAVDMSGKDAHAFVDILLRRQARFIDARNIVTIDGLRAEYDDGFGLVRASNTTSSLVLRFEAQTNVGLRRIQAQFRRLLLAADDGLGLPF